MQFPVNRTVRLTDVWLTGMEYTKFIIGTTRSPVNSRAFSQIWKAFSSKKHIWDFFSGQWKYYLKTMFNSFSESGFVCLEIERKSENILSLRMGRLSRNQDEACNTQLFFDANIPTSTIISKFYIHVAKMFLNGQSQFFWPNPFKKNLLINSYLSLANCNSNKNNFYSYFSKLSKMTSKLIASLIRLNLGAREAQKLFSK